jgi:hypothetical protein
MYIIGTQDKAAPARNEERNFISRNAITKNRIPSDEIIAVRKFNEK